MHTEKRATTATTGRSTKHLPRARIWLAVLTFFFAVQTRSRPAHAVTTGAVQNDDAQLREVRRLWADMNEYRRRLVALTADEEATRKSLEAHFHDLETERDSHAAYEEQIRKMQEGQGRELRAERDRLAAHLEDERRQLDLVNASSAKSTTRSRYASVILLVGLLVEIIGALLLSGPALVAKQEDVFSLRGTPGLHDMGRRDVLAEPRVNFLGSLGAFVLATGFVVQFIGTLVTLALRPLWAVPMVLVGVVAAGAVLYGLLGQTPEQPTAKKLRVIMRNVRRNFALPWPYLCRCEYCCRPVDVASDEVWWLEQENTKEHPYLQQPHAWHVGHPECLNESGWYSPVKIVGGDPRATRRAKLPEFVSTIAPRYHAWWARYHEHWAPSWRKANNPTAHEDELARVLARVRRVVPGTEPRAEITQS